MYIVYSRYEHYLSTGKTWTDWFAVDEKPRTESEAKEYLKSVKEDYKYIDKKTKLKHEFKLGDYDEYMKNREELMKSNEDLKAKQEEYYKSDEYKKLLKSKKQSAKELKAKQQKYLEEHS